MKKIFRSTNSLPIARFFRIVETDDLRNLIHKFDHENPNIELKPDQQIQLESIFNDIYFEYCEISENHKLKGILKKQVLLKEWEFEYLSVIKILELYEKYKRTTTLELLNELNDLKYKIDFEKNIEEQIKRIDLKIKGLKNKILIFKSKLAESIKNQKTDVKMDLDEDALYLEKNLELKREIDPEKTSVNKWIKMIQINKKKSKQHG